MKRRMIAAFLCTVLVIAGCSNNGSNSDVGSGAPAKTEETAEATTDSVEAESTESDTAEAESTESETAQADSSEEGNSESDSDSAEAEGTGKYGNDLFEITIPDELKDIVEVDVSEDRIDVFHKESKDAGYGGYAFGVWAAKLPGEYAGGPYTKIGEITNGDAEIYDVVKCMPTEVQWDYNEDEPEDFVKIDKAEDAILSSVTGVNDFSYVKGAGTKGEDIYKDVLAKYVQAVNEGWDADKLESEGMSAEFNNVASADEGNGLDAIGFAYADTNIDGIDELFVGPIDEGDAKGIAYDIYTMVDRKPALVVSGGARDRYYNYDGHFICNEWSGGAAQSGYDLYALMYNETEMVLQYGYKYDGYENENEPWFKQESKDKFESITEDEFNKAIDEMTEKYVRFDYTPLSKIGDSQGAAEGGEAQDETGAKLPAYEYPGPELFYSVLYQYIIDECGSHFEKADVGIPCPIIVAMDESDKSDIKVWGDFWYYNYELDGDTLEMVSGGSFPGCIHIKNTDEGYEVTNMELVGDGSDWEPTAKKIFGDHYDELIKSNADTDANEKARAQIIANYVAANNLSITQYKDSGWDPVKLPEENIDSFYSQLD